MVDCLCNDSTIVCFVDQIYVFTLTYYNNNTIVVYAYHKLKKALNIEDLLIKTKNPLLNSLNVKSFLR